MRARYILETGQWEKIALDAGGCHPQAPSTLHMPGMPGMAMPGSATPGPSSSGRAPPRSVTSRPPNAAKRRLRAAREKLERADGLRRQADRDHGEADWRDRALGQGQKDEALHLAKEAMDIELTLAAPSGPPDPIKPALEFYGEMLLEAGRTAEADAAFEAVACNARRIERRR